MQDLMKKLLLLKMLTDLEEENSTEFDEELSDTLVEYELKFMGVLYCLIRQERHKPGFVHAVPLVDVCTKSNKMFMAHILHLLDEFGIIKLNEDNTEMSLNKDSLLALALLKDENVTKLFDDLFSPNDDSLNLFEDVNDSSCDDDTDYLGKCSLEDIFKLGGI